MLTKCHFSLLHLIEFLDNCLLCQDAHEFLIFLINHINEIIVGEQSPSASNGCRVKTPGETDSESSPTWINEIFQVRKLSLQRKRNNVLNGVQGILTSETRCLNCETVTSKDEEFCDLSIDVDQNTSLTSCLRNFSSTETLCSDNKFKCDTCSSYQVQCFSHSSFELIYRLIV